MQQKLTFDAYEILVLLIDLGLSSCNFCQQTSYLVEITTITNTIKNVNLCSILLLFWYQFGCRESGVCTYEHPL